MTRRDALRVLALLPRYQGANYRIDGRRTLFNGQLLPPKIDKLLTQIMRKTDRPDQVRLVDVSGENVWFMHHSLWFANLRFMVRSYPKFQRWRRTRLPLVIKYAGKLVVWNGTHRTVTCRLYGVRLRAMVIDFDQPIRKRA
jgi:hypothetical protein